MVKSNTFKRYAKKESANVRKCLRDNKLKANTTKTVEYVSNKKRNNKKLGQKREKTNIEISDDDSNDSDDDGDNDDDEKLPNGRPQPLPKNMKVEFPTFDTMPTATSLIRLHDAGQLSRLIYPNPVCFLTTVDADGSKRNVMTLSWLCPANNYGGFVFVIHKTRYSASNIAHHKLFNLSVANASQLELLSAIGKVSGKGCDKYDGSIPGLVTVPFGRYSNNQADEEGGSRKMKWEYLPENAKEIQKTNKKSASINAFSALGDSSDDEDNESEKEEQSENNNVEDSKDVAPAEEADAGKKDSATKKSKTLSDPLFIEGSVAHLRCKVLSMTDAADAGHYLVVANIVEAAVHPQYWTHKGKCLAPVVKELPSIVSFLGSQQFGTTSPL